MSDDLNRKKRRLLFQHCCPRGAATADVSYKLLTMSLAAISHSVAAITTDTVAAVRWAAIRLNFEAK